MDDVVERTATLDTLTEKQREVLRLVAEGMTSKEIARKLGISESAVNQRIEVIRQRLGGLPRSQIARLYRRMSTVVITVPASNSITGKSIQLQPELPEAQHPGCEGAEVSTTLSQASVRLGSHSSQVIDHTLSSALNGPSSRWVRISFVLGLALAIMALAVLSLSALSVLGQLTKS